MSTHTPADTCPSCGSAIRPGAIYCRECGDTNLNADLFHRPAPAEPAPAAAGAVWSTSTGPSADAAAPTVRPRTSDAHSARPTSRKPRWFLGTFWALFTLVVLFAGIVGPKWLLLVAVATGAYSVYLYRGGRYGWFFF